MKKLIIISALVLSFSIQAQYVYPHPKKFTQRQIDNMSNSYLRGLRRAYPEYLITRSNVSQEVDHDSERVYVINGYRVYTKPRYVLQEDYDMIPEEQRFKYIPTSREELQNIRNNNNNDEGCDSEKLQYVDVEELNENYRTKYKIKQKYGVKLKNGKYKYLEESELELIKLGDIRQFNGTLLLSEY